MSRLADTTVECRVGPVRLWALKTAIPGIASLTGSFDIHPDPAAGEGTLTSVTAALLDRGTLRRDRFEVASVLEERGATVSFSDRGIRLGFSARFLRDDLDAVLDVLGEQLRQPRFDPAELEKVRSRMLAAIRRSADDTGHRASVLLSAALYGPGHPNRVEGPEVEEVRLAAVDRERVSAYHDEAFRGPVRVAAAGDLDPDEVATAIARAFDGWPEAGRPVADYPDPSRTEPGRGDAHIADRPNLDIRIGHSLGLRRGDGDYEALRLGCFVLGGNFSARLMTRIRDERGLTYGIGSALRGIDTRHSGAWLTSAGLSAGSLEEGTAATMLELERFVREGAGPDEVAEKSETLAGRFTVSLATSGGTAWALLRTMERGEDLERLGGYSDRIRSIEVDRVNDAARRHLDPGRLFVAVAGSISPRE